MDNIIKRYDAIFFNQERINTIIDNLYCSRERPLAIKVLEIILCQYIHCRVRISPVIAIPMNIDLVIDTNNIELEGVSEDIFFEDIKYVVSELHLKPIIQKAHKKIHIELY